MEEENRSMAEAPQVPGEQQKALAEAYGWYQHNIQQVDALVYDLTIGARAGRPVGELLALALEAIDRMLGSSLREELKGM